MTRYGYFLPLEDHSPGELVRQAKLAEQAGFDGRWISDQSNESAVRDDSAR